MSGRWTAHLELVHDARGNVRAECRGAPSISFGEYLEDGEATARDIATRLNGPSPAEVAAFLHSVEWSSLEGATEGSYGHNRCPSCEGFEPNHEPDCKLDAMIKQCEGA